jgi:hypothetical protein
LLIKIDHYLEVAAPGHSSDRDEGVSPCEPHALAESRRYVQMAAQACAGNFVAGARFQGKNKQNLRQNQKVRGIMGEGRGGWSRGSEEFQEFCADLVES